MKIYTSSPKSLCSLQFFHLSPKNQQWKLNVINCGNIDRERWKQEEKDKDDMIPELQFIACKS